VKNGLLKRKIAKMKNHLLENLHLPLWLIKDACWALGWKIMGMIMVFPALSFAFFLVYKTRKKAENWIPNCSV